MSQVERKLRDRFKQLNKAVIDVRAELEICKRAAEAGKYPEQWVKDKAADLVKTETRLDEVHLILNLCGYEL